MRYDCEICRGSGVIRLPLYRRTAIRPTPGPMVVMEEAARTFACPECGDSIPLERLAVVQSHSEIRADIDDPEFMPVARRNAAQLLVRQLLETGFIRFETGPTDERTGMRAMRATLGVASANHVATLERRIAAQQSDVAAEVVEEAGKDILHWGSVFTGPDGTIFKRNAVQMIKDAMTRVLARRAAFKAA